MYIDVMTGGRPLRAVQQLATDAMTAGFSGLVVTEGGRTAYLSCAAAALAAPGLDLSTGVAVAFPRSPMVTAANAWELAEVSGGRFHLGIGTQVHYLPVHHQPYYRNLYGDIKLDGADAYYARCLSLPIFPQMTDEDVSRVVHSIQRILAG